ncbi:MAG: VWA domain-containing protein [Marinicella sp.]|nr:VWA domain-containing protein [Xanthomonadales bacterium]
MEEWVGEKWHHFITKKSSFHYKEVAVDFDDISHQIGVFFRTLGGDAGITLGFTSALPNYCHRNWLQKISGTGKKSESGHFSGDFLYLPEKIDYFPDKNLNENLYFWLAAMASFNLSPNTEYPIEHNQYLTQQVLQQWPGLKPIYQQLVQAHLKQRPAASSLPPVVQQAEQAIRKVLLNPFEISDLRYDAQQMPQPVNLWLKAVDEKTVTQMRSRQEANGTQTGEQKPNKKQQKNKRYQAEQVENTDGKDGFMSFRLESLFSWSEFINLDRSEDDGNDDDAVRVADDMDKLSVNNGETGNKIRIDLDLPSSDYDDWVLSDGILLPEWDYKQQKLIKNHCSLQLMQLKLTEEAQWPKSLKQQARKLRRQFESLKPISFWNNRQADGEEIDLNAYLDFNTSLQLGQSISEPMLYRQKRKQTRDLSSLILTDLSLSTDAYANDEKKVIDVIKDSLYLLAESLNAAGERFAIAGFTSKNRNHVRYYDIKDFDQPFDNHCQNQIHAIKPAYYTRMGAAIRYASGQLAKQSTTQKLLLILTDGKPNDLDKYESRYGLEDTKQAIIEAKNQGLTPFCVSIDYQAADYLPYLFGAQGYLHLNNALELPKKLPKVFYQLVN